MINRRFISDERGDTNIISIIALLLISCLLAVLFSEYLEVFIRLALSNIEVYIGVPNFDITEEIPSFIEKIQYSSQTYNMILCLFVVSISISDIIEHRIPNFALAVLIINRILFLLFSAENFRAGIEDSIGGALLAFLIVVISNIFLKHYRSVLVFKPGDIKLISVTFFCVGISGSAIVLLTIAVCLFATIMFTFYRKTDYIKELIPFAPYLTVGLIAHMFIDLINK